MRIATPEEIFQEIRRAHVLHEEIKDDGRHVHLSNGKLLIVCGRQVIAYVQDDRVLQ